MPITNIRGQQILNGTVQYVDIQNVTASRLLGNPTATAATMSEVTLGTGLSFSGGALVLSANLQSLSGLSYSSASFVKMTAAGTFQLDPATYITAAQTYYIGTTQNALNRASAAQSLTGITSIDGYATNIRTGTTTDLNAAWTTLGDNIDNALQLYRYQNTALNSPEVADNANWVMNIYSHPKGGGIGAASYGHQISGVDNNNLYIRYVQNGSFGAWYKIWTAATLTNLNQLTNGPGYLTAETDTLATVTGRGATTNSTITAQRFVQNSHSTVLSSNSYATESAVFANALETPSNAYPGYGFHKSNVFGSFLYATSGTTLRLRDNGTTDVLLYHSGNLTNLNQLTNGPGYTTNVGTVTSVSGTGTVSGLTLSGTVTTSGNLTLGGTLSLTAANVNAVGAITNNTSGNAATSTISSQVTINYNDNSNGTYQMLWGSGNSVYGTSLIYCNPSTDIIYAYGYRGSGNVGGTAEASWHPAGIYCGGTMWQYGEMYKSNTGINDVSEIYVNQWFRNNTINTGLYNQQTTQHWSSKDNGYWDASSTSTVSSIRFWTGSHLGTLRGYVYADNASNIGFLNSAGSWSLRCDNSGNIYATGDVSAFSDARVKTNVETIENALDKVTSMRGVKYNRTDTDDNSEKIGVIAQEMQEVIPQVVSQNSDGMLGVSYGNLAGVFIEAIKEQQKQIEELKKQIEYLVENK